LGLNEGYAFRLEGCGDELWPTGDDGAEHGLLEALTSVKPGMLSRLMLPGITSERSPFSTGPSPLTTESSPVFIAQSAMARYVVGITIVVVVVIIIIRYLKIMRCFVMALRTI